jgi:hypothetical protein
MVQKKRKEELRVMSPFVRGSKSSLSSSDLGCILDVVNDAAKAYNGVIPEDRMERTLHVG